MLCNRIINYEYNTNDQFEIISHGVKLLYFNLVWGSRDMIVSPFYDNDIFASFTNYVTYLILVPAHVLNKHFLTWAFGTVNTDEQNISSCNTKYSPLHPSIHLQPALVIHTGISSRHCELVLFRKICFFKAHAFRCHFAGI